MTARDNSRALLDVLTEPLARMGLDLEDVQVSSAGRRKMVRVVIDKDGGICLDDIADATRDVNAVLDATDVMGEMPYTLEVTSPGVDRPLTQPRHWRRNVDRLVKVSPYEGTAFIGRILTADGDAWPYSDIAKARIEIEFNRPNSATEPRQPSRRRNKPKRATAEAVLGEPPGREDKEE
jgi:ribosome maturation factor RimP